MTGVLPPSGVSLGERPLSRRELARIVTRLRVVADAAEGRDDAARVWARAELAEIAAALAEIRERPERRVLVAGAIRGETRTSDAPVERIESNGLGDIDAVTSSFGAGRQGWPTEQGTSLSVAGTALLASHSRWAIVVEPRFSRLFGEAGERSQLELQRAYARGVWRNVAFAVGRDEQHWGQSAVASLFLSGHALPFPSVSVSADTAFRLPGALRRIGPLRLTAFLADLGGSQRPSHARLAGWQATFQPRPRFEIGVAVLTQTGGSGAPKATLFEHVVDLFPLIDALAPQHADLQISNKLAGGNLRLRVPELSNLDVYYELQIDDFDGRRLRNSLSQDAAHLIGVRLPVALPIGHVSTRVEWHHTSIRLYEHAQFQSGVTYRGRLLGDPLGPNATGAYLDVEWRPSSREAVQLKLADERRDPSLYASTSNDPRDRGFRFVKLTAEPQHRRRRAVLHIEPGGILSAAAIDVGYARVWRAGDRPRAEWLGQLSLSRRPRTF